MRILVTGIFGARAQEIAKIFLNKGHKVLGLGRSSHKRTLPFPLEVFEQDLAGPLHYLPKVDVICHMASCTPVRQANATDEDYQLINVKGTANLCAYAVQSPSRLFVYFSSMAVYGQPSSSVVSLATSPQPQNSYARSKLDAEDIVRHQKVPSLILRLPGYVCAQDQEHPWIAQTLHKLLHHQDLRYFGPEQLFNNIVDSSFLTSVIEQFMNVPPQGSQTLNLCSKEPIKIKDLLLELQKVGNSKSKLIPAEQFMQAFSINSEELRNAGISVPTTQEVVRRFVDKVTQRAEQNSEQIEGLPEDLSANKFGQSVR